MTSKLLTIALVFISFNSAFAFGQCKNREAQFIGKIAETRTVKIDNGIHDCMIKIDFYEVKPSMVCPLHIGTVQEVYADDSRCEGRFEVGAEISGYLIQDQNGQTYLEH